MNSLDKKTIAIEVKDRDLQRRRRILFLILLFSTTRFSTG